MLVKSIIENSIERIVERQLKVSGYTRADGTEVDSYLRTNPGGIEENNFSYKGY